ncbi:MAG: hypothetical protein DKINENOH_01609 [bacterium]|nr:hypothetical protein [bacterium]
MQPEVTLSERLFVFLHAFASKAPGDRRDVNTLFRLRAD